MPDYKNGKIYGIYHNDELVYIGSTTQVLCRRMSGHKNDAKKKEKSSTAFYKYYNENDSKEFKIILIETCECETKEELLKREAEIQRENPSTYNSRLPYKTPEEWEEYKLKRKEYQKIIYKDYREKNLEEIRKNENERSKKYSKENRKLRNEIQLKSNKKNEYQIECDCGSKFMNRCRWQHYKSKKHIEYLENSKNEKV